MSSEDEDFNDIYGEEPEKQQENKQDVVVEKKEEPKKDVEEPTKIDSSANEQLAALQALTSSINQAQSSASVTTEKSEPPKETSVSSGNSYTNNMPVSNTLFQQQQPPHQQPQRGGRADLSKDSSKLFIGGLNWETDEDKLKNYFSKYGNVIDLKIMRDNATGRSRGFGFLTFAEPQSVDEVVKTQHILDGKVIDPKRAIPKDEQDKTGKIFVGGIGADVRPKEFEQFFSQWGTIIDAQLMLDKDTGRSRGYGFITYDTPEAVDRVCQNKYIDFKGKKIEIKRAAPRHLQKGSSRNSGGNSSFGGHNDSGNSWSGSAGNGANAVPIGTAANNSSNNNMYGNQNMMNMNPMFNPQMMQEYYQKMQEYYTQFQNGAYAPQQGGASGQPPMPMMPNMPNMPMMPGQPQSQQQQPQASYESGSDSSSNNGGRNRDTRSNHRAHPRRQENRGYHPYK